MKKIAVVLLFFFALSSGVLLFFVSKTRQDQNISTLAKDGTPKTLGLLINDCNVMFHPECLPPGGPRNTVIIHSIIETILNEQPNQAFARYREKHLPVDFPDLFNPDEQTTLDLSVADILTRIVVRKQVNYKVMIALMNAENQDFLNRTDMDVKRPYGLSENSVLEELNTVADFIVNNMQSPHNTPFKIGNSQYGLDLKLNKGSDTVYSFLASTSKDPFVFQQKLERFQKTWKNLYDEAPLSDKPYFVNNAKENPLPTPFDQAPPPIEL